MTEPPSRRKPPPRKPARRPIPIRRKRPRWRSRVILASIGLLVALLAWAVVARQLAPASNTTLTRFDAIIVLGAPADSDGNPTPEQLARVTEAVHEYSRGVAPRLILTGGPAHNHFVEAQVMARTAHAQGIPDSAIFIEPEAKDTIQNACYAVRMMRAHGWHSAEVVSRASHLPRAAIVFSTMPLEFRVHAALALQPESPAYRSAATAIEILKTLRYLVWASHTEHCEP